MVVMVGGREPHALLCSRTLVPLGWKDASRLGIKPWTSARQQASTAPSLHHHQIWATSMWASSRQLFLLVSNLLFVLASMLSMSREGCWGGNRGGETCRYQRYQQRLCALKVMFANQISED